MVSRGQIEDRQRRAGVTHYRWFYTQTRRACAHADRDGKVYSWEGPPSGGHPGSEEGCMCIAMACLPDFDDLNDLIVHAGEPSDAPAYPQDQGFMPGERFAQRLWRFLARPFSRNP